MKPLATAAMILLPLTVLSATPEQTLTKRYKEFNRCILKGDSRSITTWVTGYCTKGFNYTSYQKNKFNRDTFLSGLLQQIDKTAKVLKSDLVIRGFEKHGSTIVATVSMEFKGIVNYDSRRLTLTDLSVTQETWAYVGKDWKLQKVVQVNADTQMQQEEGSKL